MHKIFKLGFALGYKHPNDIWLSTLNTFFNFIRAESITKTVILGLLVLQATLL